MADKVDVLVADEDRTAPEWVCLSCGYTEGFTPSRDWESGVVDDVACNRCGSTSTNELGCTDLGELVETLKAERLAAAELIKCCEVTVKAFEALGRTNGIVDQLESHRACERALIEQKAALARIGAA